MGGIERTVYFVCDDQSFQSKREAWGVWVDGGMYGKERTHFEEVFTGQDVDYYGRTIAWWSIDSDFAWTLDREVADDLLEGLQGSPALTEGKK